MKFLAITFALAVAILLAIGCNSAPGPTDPDPNPAVTGQFTFPDQTGTDWEGVNTTYYQDLFLMNGLDKIIYSRTAQDDDPGGPGMSAAQGMAWMAYWITDTNFGWGPFVSPNPFTGCDIYITAYYQFTAYNDGSAPPPLSWWDYVQFVFMMNGYPVPSEPDCEPCNHCPYDYESPFGEMVCMSDLE